MNGEGIAPQTWHRYHYDAEYHALVHLVGHLCWLVGDLRDRVQR